MRYEEMTVLLSFLVLIILVGFPFYSTNCVFLIQWLARPIWGKLFTPKYFLFFLNDF